MKTCVKVNPPDGASSSITNKNNAMATANSSLLQGNQHTSISIVASSLIKKNYLPVHICYSPKKLPLKLREKNFARSAAQNVYHK